jgi:hypothetical protein
MEKNKSAYANRSMFGCGGQKYMGTRLLLHTKKDKKKRTRVGRSAARACFQLMMLCSCQALRIVVEKATRIICGKGTERNTMMLLQLLQSIQRASISTTKLLMQYDSSSHHRKLPCLKLHASLKLTFGHNAYEFLIHVLMMIDYCCYRVLALKKSSSNFDAGIQTVNSSIESFLFS